MSAQNKDIIRRVADELWNQQKLDVIDQMFHPDFRSLGPGVSEVQDREEFRAGTKATLTSFPDFHSDIVDTIAEGDRVVTIWNSQGTFEAELRGTPPNHKVIQWSGVSVTRILDGKIMEIIWGYDTLGATQMMGAIPTLATET